MSDDGWNKSHELATQYAVEAIRALVLANGGAVVAILTFIGHAPSDRVDARKIAAALGVFGVGLVFALITAMLAYLAQGAATQGWTKRNNWFEGASTVAAILSVTLFAVGAFTAWRGFVVQPPTRVATVTAPTCDQAVAFIRAQADAGSSSAHNGKLNSDAVLVRGGWVILPPCK